MDWQNRHAGMHRHGLMADTNTARGDDIDLEPQVHARGDCDFCTTFAYTPENRVLDDSSDPSFQARQEANVPAVKRQVKVEVGHLYKSHLQQPAEA